MIDPKTLTGQYIRSYENNKFLEIATIYNDQMVRQAKYMEDEARKTYAHLQQVYNSLTGNSRYKDWNWIRQGGMIVGYRLCDFPDLLCVLDNHAQKEVNQPDHKPDTRNKATERATQPTYKGYHDIYFNNLLD